MQKEFDEKENDITIRNHTSAINNSIFKPSVSEVDTKQYLEEEAIIFFADMTKMM
jgi:hypothetical protein